MRGESSNLVLASTSTTPQETHGCYMMLCCQLNFLPDTWASHFCKLHFCKQTAVPSMASDKTRLCQLASRLRAVSACLYQRILSCPIQLALASAHSTAARLLASNRSAIRARKNRTLFPVATSEKYKSTRKWALCVLAQGCSVLHSTACMILRFPKGHLLGLMGDSGW